MNKTAVVILNYNGKNWLQKFLPNVVANTKVEIIVADNASTDDSIQFLEKHYTFIRIIKNHINTGYAGGYNEALKQIEAAYYVLLNSDVEVTPNWVENTIGYMQNDASIAACQPKILSYHEKNKFEYAGAAGGFIDKYGYPFCRGRIFDTCEEDAGQYNESGEIFWASGACLFVQAKLFHEIGGFDADFFAHMEEIDLCWRLKNAGYKICYCADSTVYHVGGGTLNKSNPKKTMLNFRNNRKLLRKNLSEKELQTIYKTRNNLDFIATAAAYLKGNFKEAKAIRNGIKEYQQQIKQLNIKRKNIEQIQSAIKIGNANKTGILNESIVKLYFIKQLKKFSQITWNK